MKQLLGHIEQLLEIKLKDPNLMITAFNHTSYVNEKNNPNLQHNERLEFLGDAVLEIISSDYLYHTYPKKPEGQLSRLRAQLVREESLAYLARKFQFNHFIRLGRGELASGGQDRDSILADCFEAFLGAIYLDQGMACVKGFLDQVLLEEHQKILSTVNQDFKTLFQEKVQQKGNVKIRYELLGQVGPAHEQVFTMGLYMNAQLIAPGKGKTKKQAETQAAQTGFDLVDEKGNVHVSRTN